MPRVVVDGADLSYAVVGEGPETVALLNGIGMTMSNWRPISDRLVSAGYRVVTHDFQGQLRSGGLSSPRSLAEHAGGAVAVLRDAGIGRAHVVGTSFGAAVALSLAVERPDACASVVTIAGAGGYDAVLAGVMESWKAAALTDPRAFCRSMAPWNYSAGYIETHRAELAAYEDQLAGLGRGYFEGFGRLCDAFLAMDLSRSLASVRCPCLALAATEDILIPGRYSRAIVEAVPGALYGEIAGAGHAVVIERPESVADRLLPFLKAARDERI